MYVLIDNGAVSKYPYTITDLIRSNTQVSFPRNPSAAQLAEFGLFEVTATSAPSHNALTEVLVDSTPALVNGTWTQVWSVRAATAEEMAQRKQADLEAVRAHAQSLILEKYPLWVQINYANGVYPESGVAAMAADIAAVITESNRLEDAIEAGTPATANWPVI